MNVLLAITGSVAATKIPQLIDLFAKTPETNLKIITTNSAKQFIDLTDTVHYCDKDELEWTQKGDEIIHISLMQWASILVIAPLSANTLAKIALGLNNNLVTNVVRAWDLNKTIVMALAMNTNMYNNPLTKQHLDLCNKIYKVEVVYPVEKMLACNVFGVGGMEDVKNIYDVVMKCLLNYSQTKHM